jgi:tetraacyldisaccharide 4'-kinase
VESVLDPTGTACSVASLRGKKVFVFCGLARPLRVVRTVQSLGAEAVGSRFFPDHHSFSARDLDSVLRMAKAHGADLIVTSEKDLARLPEGFPAWALSLAVEITEGSEHLFRLLDL